MKIEGIHMKIELNPGCWIDGAIGQLDAEVKMLAIAISEGYIAQTESLQYCMMSAMNDKENITTEMRDTFAVDITLSLRWFEIRAQEGYWIGWQEGDFGMWVLDDVE